MAFWPIFLVIEGLFELGRLATMPFPWPWLVGHQNNILRGTIHFTVSMTNIQSLIQSENVILYFIKNLPKYVVFTLFLMIHFALL